MARSEAEKMEFMNRGKINGFKAYFSQRRAHFLDVFEVPYSDKAAEVEFNNIMEMTGNLRQRSNELSQEG
jgi:hypothetical protein